MACVRYNYMKSDLLVFAEWLRRTKFRIQPWTNEKTIQNQLGVFLNYWLPKTSLVELEVNVTKLVDTNLKLRKKEADIIIRDGDQYSVIEVKFWRDKGTYNIGMFRCFEDVAFVEQLRHIGFSSSAVLFFTEIPEHYTRATKTARPKNEENAPLYTAFRQRQEIHGAARIKTGKLDESVTVNGNYPLTWNHLIGNIHFCVIEI